MQSALLPEQYRLLVEAAPTLVWRAGLDAKCDYFNETWLAYTGRTLAQESGDGWAEGVHPDDLQRCVEYYLTHFERRVAFEMEYRLRRHDGVYRWIFDRGVPFSTDDGVFAGFIGSCVDVHERVAADAAKTTFLSMLAHELRTPMQPLLTYSAELERLALGGEPVPLMVAQRIRRQSDRLHALIEHASRGIGTSLGLSSPMEAEDLDLVALVEEAVRAQREAGRARTARSASLAVRVEGEPQTVRADRVGIAQVLDIALDNALKYSPEGGAIEALVDFTLPGRSRIQIADEGIGIPEAELARVGTPYFRASNASTRQYSGMGLGLAIACDVAKAHGGELAVARRTPAGTVLTLTLPDAREVAL